jgi:hypothetical protein
MNLTVKFFPVGCGDAISIRFLGNDDKYHNILIDGGYQYMYPFGIKKEMQGIIEREEHIDLCMENSILKTVSISKLTQFSISTTFLLHPLPKLPIFFVKIKERNGGDSRES